MKGTFSSTTFRRIARSWNPIERVWKLTRKLCIHDVYFPNLEAVITAVEAQFAQWAQGNETLRRLCSI